MVQFKDNPKELVWEFKRLMLDNEMKTKEISFLKNRVDDLKRSDEEFNSKNFSIFSIFLVIFC